MKKSLPKTFFLNGKLHSVLETNKGRDYLVMWCYYDRTQVAGSYLDTLHRYEKAYKTSEAAKLFDVAKNTFEMSVNHNPFAPRVGEIQYTLRGRYQIKNYFFSKEDIIKIWQYFQAVADEVEFKAAKPKMFYISRRELEAKMRGEEVIYVKTADGSFRPLFKKPV